MRAGREARSKIADTRSPDRDVPAIAIAMKPSPAKEPARKQPPTWLLNTLTALVGVLTLALGIGWIVYKWVVDMEVPYFAIPLVMCVPVIVAVAFRNMWD